jgi:hypothetical protein
MSLKLLPLQEKKQPNQLDRYNLRFKFKDYVHADTPVIASIQNSLGCPVSPFASRTSSESIKDFASAVH